MLPYEEQMKTLRRKRKQLGLQQKSVANKVGISPSQLNRMEHGNTQANYQNVYNVWRYLKSQDEQGETADELMQETIEWLELDDTCLKAKRIMRENDFSQLPIREDSQQRGSICEEDFLREDISSDDRVAEVRGEPFLELPPTTNKSVIRELFKDGHQAILVQDGDEYLGIITKADLL